MGKTMTWSQADSKVIYKQCKLTRGDTVTHSWLPEKFAKKGKVVKIRDRDADWSDGWTVERVGTMRLPGSIVSVLENVHSRTRKHSDI